jgi:hypothetical protein
LKYKELHHQAKHIDRLIDAELYTRGGLFLTHEQLQSLVEANYPDFYGEKCGWHKIVFRNKTADHKAVLKIGPKKSIENDHRTYRRVPEETRHRFFAKMFWHTKYCLLQEFGEPATATQEQLDCVRHEVYKFGIIDIKADNLRWIDGELKIVDANFTNIPLPTMMRKIDEIKPKLPKKLHEIIKKFTKRLYES